jgi:hypothetical protein
MKIMHSGCFDDKYGGGWINGGGAHLAAVWKDKRFPARLLLACERIFLYRGGVRVLAQGSRMVIKRSVDAIKIFLFFTVSVCAQKKKHAC